MAAPVDALPGAMAVEAAIAFFTAPEAPRRHKSYPVVDAAGRLVGMVARADILRWTREGWPTGQSLAQAVAGRCCVTGFEDELIGRLADRMAEAEAGRVPILRRSDGAVIGLVARRDLLRVRRTVADGERGREALIRLRKRRDSVPA
jgi:CBS domain-containing protein